jgi:hypothetical protein
LYCTIQVPRRFERIWAAWVVYESSTLHTTPSAHLQCARQVGRALEFIRQDGPAEEASSGLACIRSCSCGARIGTSSTSSTPRPATSARAHWHNVWKQLQGGAQTCTGQGERFSTTAERTGPLTENASRGAGRRRHRPMVAAACRTPAPPRALHLRRNAARLKIGYTSVHAGRTT